MKMQKSSRPFIVDDVRVGNIIKTARKNMGMTQEQLAEAVDITPAFIGHIERGSKSLSLTTLLGIARTLNLSVDYLLSEQKISTDKKILNDFAQLIQDRPTKTKKAVLDVVRTVLKYLD